MTVEKLAVRCLEFEQLCFQGTTTVNGKEIPYCGIRSKTPEKFCKCHGENISVYDQGKPLITYICTK